MRHPLAITALLAFAVLIALLCALGVLVMRDPYQRVHYTAPAASVSAMAIAAAVLLAEGFNQAGIKTLLVMALLFLMNAVLSHATARAGRIREFGRWQPHASERDAAEDHKEQA